MFLQSQHEFTNTSSLYIHPALICIQIYHVLMFGASMQQQCWSPLTTYICLLHALLIELLPHLQARRGNVSQAESSDC